MRAPVPNSLVPGRCPSAARSWPSRSGRARSQFSIECARHDTTSASAATWLRRRRPTRRRHPAPNRPRVISLLLIVTAARHLPNTARSSVMRPESSPESAGSATAMRRTPSAQSCSLPVGDARRQSSAHRETVRINSAGSKPRRATSWRFHGRLRTRQLSGSSSSTT